MKISSQRKFICEDLLFEFGFIISLIVALKKISSSIFLVSIVLILFLILSSLFKIVLSRIDFFKRNVSRFITCLLCFISSTISLIMPILGSAVTIFESQVVDFASQDRGKLISVLANESEVLGFLIIIILIDSFIFALRAIGFFHINMVYKKLRFDILGQTPNKILVFVKFLLYCAPLLLLAGLLIIYSRFYNSILSYIFSMVFTFASLIVLSRNPITLREQKRLDIYLNELNREDSLSILTQRYKDRIVKRWVESYNLPFASEFIMGLCRFFLSMKVKGKENIKISMLPSVFVANHGEIIGPICGTCYIPSVFRPYVHDHMCDVEKSTNRMWKYTFKGIFGFLGETKGLKLSRFIAKITTHLINSFEPIHSYVSENDPRKSMKSMHDGLECLLDGDSMLIFPENPSKTGTGRYAVGEVGALYSGFAHIGKLYNDATKRNLYFYPMFINKKKRLITIGEPVIFNNTDNVVTEKKRVAEEIQNRMNESK